MIRQCPQSECAQPRLHAIQHPIEVFVPSGRAHPRSNTKEESHLYFWLSGVAAGWQRLSDTFGGSTGGQGKEYLQKVVPVGRFLRHLPPGPDRDGEWSAKSLD